MMFERDYILRMIQMMGDWLRRLAELLSDLERMRFLGELCRRHCGMTLKAAEALSDESLVSLLDPEPRFLLSELIYLHAAQTTCDDEQAQALLAKSLRLLLSLSGEGELCEQRAARLGDLKEQTLPLLTAEELMACAGFLVNGERYDLAEDAAFQAIERAEPSRQTALLSQALALMERAAAASPQALALCGMTPDELAESVSLLRTLAGLAGI